MTTTTSERSLGARPWRCDRCGRLMGELHPERVHLKPRGGPIYFSRYPLAAICGGCGRSHKIERFPRD